MKVDWDELKRLHEAATPAPWRDDNGYRAYAGADDEKWLFETKHSDANGFDSTFIVAMRNALPAILAERSAAENLYDKTATLYDYLLETDEEGLIHHATQMRDVWLAVNKYRNTDEAFDKETQND